MPPINPPGALPLLVIPGVDSNAPINLQIDQIDQQITFMLQDIDENFAKIHHIITEKIIPALKRFDKDTEPVKEASKFWRSFFETAAQVQVAPGDASTASGAGFQNESYQDEVVPQDTTTVPTSASGTEEVSSSFLGPAVSSTPLPGTVLSTHHISPVPSGEEASWAASVESPFTKLDRQLRDDLKMDERDRMARMGMGGGSMVSTASSGAPELSPLYAAYPPTSSMVSSSAATVQPAQAQSSKAATTTLPMHDIFAPPAKPPTAAAPPDKGKQRAQDAPPVARNAPLLKNVLVNNALANQRTPRARYNPFSQPSDNQPGPTGSTPGRSKKWNGIADLRLPSPAKPRSHKTPVRPGVDSDSSDDDLPPGMSPPVTMNFTLPAKKLLRTPAKEVARMAVEGMMKGVGGDTPSPPEEERGSQQHQYSYGWEDPGERAVRMAHPTPPRRMKAWAPAEADRSLVESLGVPAHLENGHAAGRPHETPGAGINALLDAEPERGLVDDDDERGEYQDDDDDSSFEDYGSPPTQLHNPPYASSTHRVPHSADSSFSSSVDSSYSSPASAAPPPRSITVDDPLSDSDDENEGGTDMVFGAPTGVDRIRRTEDFALLGREMDEMTVHGGHVEHAVLGESPTPWPRER